MIDPNSSTPPAPEQLSVGMAEVFEDAIDLHIDLVDTVPMDPANPESLSAYPLPILKKRGEQETRRFRTVILENDYLRATFVPALGGRLLSLFDKRIERESLFSGSTFELLEGSARGVWAPQGLSIELQDFSRANSLGNVDYKPQPGMDETDPAAAWFGETFTCGAQGSRTSLQWCAAIGPGLAAMELEVRVGNRDRRSNPLAPMLSLTGSTSQNAQTVESSQAVYIAGDQNGIAMIFEEGALTAGVATKDRTSLRRTFGSTGIAPRQQDRFRMVLIPAAWNKQDVEGSSIAVTESGVALLTGKSLRFHSTQPLLGARVEILSSEGSFAAPMDFHPEKPAIVPLDSIPGALQTIAIVSAGNHVVLSIQPTPTEELGALEPVEHLRSAVVSTESSKGELVQGLARFDSRIPAGVELAIRETIATEFAKADALMDQVLTWNGDDPLAWWQKAVIRRLGSLQEEGEEDAARMNAHFLSPLEPALRAEAFLSMEQTHGKDPHPLVEPLTDNPENLVEVACIYIEHGFYVDAGRWIDEALRHKDLAILHYLQAYLFLTQSQMKAQAAEHLSRAAKSQETPLPWRPIERKAIAALSEAFPTDARLQRLKSVLDQAFPRT
jgi:hypothetical protein